MERIRSRDKVQNHLVPYVDSKTAWDSPPVRSYGSYGTYVDYDTMRDHVTPGYKRRSFDGEIIISPMSKLVSTAVITPYTITQKSADGTFTTNHWVNQCAVPVFWEDVGGLMSETKLVADAEKEAITEAFAQVGKAEVELLVSIAELPETVAMLYGPVRKGIQIIKRFRRWRTALAAHEVRDAQRRANHEKRQNRRSRRGLPVEEYVPRKGPVLRIGKLEASDIPSAWLGVRYGLLPLMYDIQGITAALRKKAQSNPRETARGNASRTGSTSVAASPPSKITAPWLGYDTKVEYSVRSRAGVLYVPKEETLSSKWGLELHRVPAAAYEAITLSFVTDWFHNAATYYDALTSHMRAKRQLGAWVVTTVEYTLSRTAVRAYPPALAARYTMNPVAGPHTQVIVTKKIRRPVTLSDAGVMAYNKLSLTRVVDGLALISTFLSRRR